jgi:ribosomal protein S14
MLFSKIKDLKLRKLFYKFEYKNKINTFIRLNLVYNASILLCNSKKLIFLYNSLSTNKNKKLNRYSKIKIVKRCIFTNRTKNIFKTYKLSQSNLRELISFGIVPGYKKAVW